MIVFCTSMNSLFRLTIAITVEKSTAIILPKCIHWLWLEAYSVLKAPYESHFVGFKTDITSILSSLFLSPLASLSSPFRAVFLFPLSSLNFLSLKNDTYMISFSPLLSLLYRSTLFLILILSPRPVAGGGGVQGFRPPRTQSVVWVGQRPLARPRDLGLTWTPLKANPGYGSASPISLLLSRSSSLIDSKFTRQ